MKTTATVEDEICRLATALRDQAAWEPASLYAALSHAATVTDLSSSPVVDLALTACRRGYAKQLTDDFDVLGFALHLRSTFDLADRHSACCDMACPLCKGTRECETCEDAHDSRVASAIDAVLATITTATDSLAVAAAGAR